jgi:ribonuclease BN (tRNA processing enzyme)
MQNTITVLGSGTCISSLYQPFDFRNPSGHLIQFENTNILLDCGEGMRGQMNKIGFDYFQLNAIFISHFHPDHFTVLPLLQSLAVRAHLTKQKKKLIIGGPKGIEAFIKDQIKNTHAEKDCLLYDDNFFTILFYEYQDEEPIHIAENIKLTPHRIAHNLPDPYALQISFGNTIIAYSGDSGMCDNLEKVAKNADIFLCESTNSIHENSATHLNAYQAAEIAKKAHVKKLVIVHYSGENTAAEMIKAIHTSGYTGNISIVNDLESFSL